MPLQDATQTPLQPLPSSTLPPPSPTPEPLALFVNGAVISLAEFREVYARYQAAQPVPLPVEEAAVRVETELVNTLLLAQAATASGFVLTEEALGERIAALEAKMGGSQALAAWQQANGYTPQSFANDLRRSVLAAWMRDSVIEAVPESAIQVRGRQVLLYNESDARTVLGQLNAGTSFDVMVSIYKPYNLGEFGWLPKGYLEFPEIEQVLFELQPGQYSDIIQTRLGYHIIQVMEGPQERPLEPDVRLALQVNALQNWLDTQRDNGDIRIYLSETKEELR